MEKRIMNGKSVSLLGFGGMRFPTNADGTINREEAIKMVRRGYEGGVNYFDTAYIYHNGESEGLYKEALSVYPRESYFIADKMPTWLVKSKEDNERIFNEQLERLGMDYIDFYLVHSISKKYWDDHIAPFGIIEFCKKLKEEGKIKHLGFSFHDDYEVFENTLNYTEWDFCQIQLNYMDTDIQAGVKGVKLAEEMGVPMVIMEPVKGGLLATMPADVIKPFTDILPDASAASWALRFVADFDNVKVILSGMSDMQQVEDNINTFSTLKPMTEADRNAIKQVKATLISRIRNGCTGCSYCMPCPQGVNIPVNFRFWNEYGTYGNAQRAKKMWAKYADEKKGKNCISCGKCVELCPQHLSIPEMLAAAQKELDELL